jgi:hypothetical protein
VSFQSSTHQCITLLHTTRVRRISWSLTPPRGWWGHFQDRPEKPPDCCCCCCWCPWLPPPLAPPCGGLGGPPDDSLKLIVPLDGGLLGAAGATFSGAGDGSDGDRASCCFGGSFFASVLKLPAMICKRNKQWRSLLCNWSVALTPKEDWGRS